MQYFFSSQVQRFRWRAQLTLTFAHDTDQRMHGDVAPPRLPLSISFFVFIQNAFSSTNFWQTYVTLVRLRIHYKCRIFPRGHTYTQSKNSFQSYYKPLYDGLQEVSSSNSKEKIKQIPTYTHILLCILPRRNCVFESIRNRSHSADGEPLISAFKRTERKSPSFRSIFQKEKNCEKSKVELSWSHRNILCQEIRRNLQNQLLSENCWKYISLLNENERRGFFKREAVKYLRFITFSP